MTGSEVRAKIGNLSTEFKKRKKEQGRTGATPSTWRYYDLIDKLIGKTDWTFVEDRQYEINERLFHSAFSGERPHNDDSLLSDSINLEQSCLFDEAENTPVPDLNLIQIAQQADDFDLDSLVKYISDPTNPDRATSMITNDSSSSLSITKPKTPGMPDATKRKALSAKKKRTADIKQEKKF